MIKYDNIYQNEYTFVRAHPDEPLMIMLCGLPGSGKSWFAESVSVKRKQRAVYAFEPVIHSLDALRGELYDDAPADCNHDELTEELHRRIKQDLLDGKDVIYDDTNIRSEDRVQFLNSLHNISCLPICVVLATEYAACLHNNRANEQGVPNEAMLKLYQEFCPPHYGEGFSHIYYLFQYLDENGEMTTERHPYYTIGEFFKTADDFDSLGKHCSKCGSYIQEHDPDNFNLLIAAMLHDNGKLLGEGGNISRSSYDSMLYLDDGTFDYTDICYISTLIYYHMHPSMVWNLSDEMRKYHEKQLGKWYQDILMLHEADEAAK